MSNLWCGGCVESRPAKWDKRGRLLLHTWPGLSDWRTPRADSFSASTDVRQRPSRANKHEQQRAGGLVGGGFSVMVKWGAFHAEKHNWASRERISDDANWFVRFRPRHILAVRKIYGIILFTSGLATQYILRFTSTHLWRPDPLVTHTMSTGPVVLRSQKVSAKFFELQKHWKAKTWFSVVFFFSATRFGNVNFTTVTIWEFSATSEMYRCHKWDMEKRKKMPQSGKRQSRFVREIWPLQELFLSVNDIVDPRLSWVPIGGASARNSGCALFRSRAAC